MDSPSELPLALEPPSAGAAYGAARACLEALSAGGGSVLTLRAAASVAAAAARGAACGPPPACPSATGRVMDLAQAQEAALHAIKEELG